MAARALGLGAFLVPIPFLLLYLAGGGMALVVLAFVLPIPVGLTAIIFGIAGMRGTTPDPRTRAGAIAGLISGAGMVGPDPEAPTEALSAAAHKRRRTAVAGVVLGVLGIVSWVVVAVVVAGIVAGVAGTD